jgi:alpha-mannosidase
VPAQQWAALDDAGGAFGVAVLSDVRSGWDQPDPSTLRMTWIHAPRASWKFRHQGRQDFGRHRFRFALAGLGRGELAAGFAAALADRFAHPALAFRAEPGGRPGGGSCRRLLAIGAPGRLLAAKPAEAGDGLICRFTNAAAEPAAIEIEIADGLALETATDGLERALAGAAQPPPAAATLPPSGLRSLRLRPRAAPAQRPADAFLHLPLPWSTRGFSRNGERLERGFDGHGNGFPLELVPDWIDDGPVPFDLGHLATPTQLALPGGEELELRDAYDELWLLAASVDADCRLRFRVGSATVDIEVPAWRQPFLRESRARRRPFGHALDPGRFRRAPVAISTGHLHDRAGGDLPVERGSLFAVRVPLHGERRVTFPRSRAVRMVAATLSRAPARGVTEAWPPLLP